MFFSRLTRLGQGLVSAILLAVLLPFVSVRAEEGVMEYNVVCIAEPGTDRRLSTGVCEDFLKLLRSTYPDRAFTAVTEGRTGPRLDLIISQARPEATALQLVWTDLQGVKREGRVESVSAMDRELSSSMQQSLYRRALMANPLPE